MVDVKKEVINILENYPDGLHFSELFRRCKTITTRSTLSKKLKELEKDSVVSRTPQEPRRGQRVYYRLTESFRKFNEQLKVLDREGDLIINEIYWLHYILEKFRAAREQIELLVDFDNSLLNQYVVLFSMAESLGRPFPEKFQKIFYNHVFEIFKNMHLRYISIVREFMLENYLETGAKPFHLRTSEVLDDLKNIARSRNYDCYLDWLKNSDDEDYRRIGLFVEKNRKRS